MDVHLWALFSIAFIAAVAVPGPNVAFAVAQALKNGFKNTLPGALGFGLATGVHALIVMSGLGVFVTKNPEVLTYLRWIGAAYLAYLALNAMLLTSASSKNEKTDSTSRSIFFNTMVVSLTNPKGWLASLLTYPTFITPDLPYRSQAILLGATAVCISLSIYGGYMLLASKARVIFENKKLIDKVTGVVYLLVAASLILLP